MSEAKWYAVHTYSGYENKVKLDIEKTVKNRHMEDQILKVLIPLQNVVEIKEGGKKKQVQKKMFPAYVLINMVYTNETWYVVRNTRGVTGFVGPGSKPVPLTDEEVEKFVMNQEEEVASFAVGDNVIVTSGVWENNVGVVVAINESQQRVTINVNMFGRDTPVDIDFWDVKKV